MGLALEVRRLSKEFEGHSCLRQCPLSVVNFTTPVPSPGATPVPSDGATGQAGQAGQAEHAEDAERELIFLY